MEFSASPFQISQSQCHIAVSSLLSFLNFFSALFYLSPRVAHPPRLLLFHPLLLLVFAERAHRCSGIQWKKKNEFLKIRWNCVRVKKRKCNRNWKSDRTRLPTLHFIAAVYSNFLSSSLHLLTCLHSLLYFLSLAPYLCAS